MQLTERKLPLRGGSFGKRSKSNRDGSKPKLIDSPLGPVLDFMRVLWAVDHGLQTTSETMHRNLGVTGPQRMVIRIVGLHPGISAGDLSTILHLHPSTLTGLLKRLVGRGLLARTRDSLDSRRAVLTLTSKGKTIDGPKPGTVEDKVRRALRALDPRDVATAETVLRVVTKALEQG